MEVMVNGPKVLHEGVNTQGGLSGKELNTMGICRPFPDLSS